MSKRRRADHVNGCQASSDMAARRLPGIPLWSIWLLLPLVIVGANSATVEPTVLLDDSTKIHTVPLRLGERPHECVGNVNLCPDGFTASFSFHPAAPQYATPAEYLVSTGGQSPTSTGYYVRRNYGMEYEVGVAKGPKLWSVSFDVDVDVGQDVNVLLTWNEGLDVYVDGMLVGADVTGRDRVFTRPAFDPLRDIIVGGAENDLMAPSRQLTLYGLKHWDTFFWQKDISTIIPAENFKMGCTSTQPNTLEPPQDLVLGEGETAADKCRNICFGKGKKLALLSSDSKCLCHTPENIANYISAATAEAPCWSVYLVSSQMTKTYPINLAHMVVLPTDKGYTRPNESIVFKLSTNTPVDVVFRFDFGDGMMMVTHDTTVSHFYTQDGTYVVNITAQTRSTVETQLETVMIEWVDEGVAPNVVKVQASTAGNSREIVVDAVAISPQKMDCILNLGDGNMKNYNDLTGLVHSKRVAHTYETVGLYDISMACTNKDGTTQAVVITPSINKSMDYETKSLGQNVIVPFYGADSHASIVDVDINYATLGEGKAILANAEIDIPGGEFSHSGEYLLQLKSKNAVLRQRVVNLQREIVSTDIVANLLHTEIDTPIQFVFKIFGGDRVHVLIEYGDGEEELLFVPLTSPKGPVMIHRNHTYTALGKYTVSLTVANDVSTSVANKLMSIERPILDASANARNVSFLGEPAEFFFQVDSGVIPAMPIRVDFDFGNGESGSGEIGDMRNDGTPAVFRYVYPKYGIYYPIVTISNNLSSLVVQFPSLQVGENITHVDMVTSSDVVELDEEFEIIIDCPKGQPILYEVMIGDGTVIKLSVPFDYTSEHDMIADIAETVRPTEGEARETTTPYTYYTTQEMGVMVTGNGTEVKLSRKKRETNPELATVTTVVVPTQNDAFEGVTAFGESGNSTVGDNSDITTTAIPTTTTTMRTTTTMAPTRPPNEKITVKYRFKVAGQYLIQVKTSNSFGYKETWSCPPMRVVPRANPLACEGMKVTTDVATSEEAPLVAHRSEEVRVGVSVDLSCAGLTSTPLYDYTWETDWRTPMGSLRPELGICHVGAPDPTLVIPGNTLWYGNYTIQAKVRLLVDSQTGRVRRAVADGVTVATAQPTAEDWKVRSNIESAKAEIAANIARQLREFSDAVQVPPASLPLNLDGKELTTITAAVNLYLQVTKTPLVATLKGDAEVSIPKFQVINLNAEESHDPDVELPMNRTGMNAHIFCHPGAQSDDWSKKTLQQKIFESTKLANNTYDNCAIYDHGCFEKTDRVWVLGWEAVFLADNLYKNDTMHFDLVVTKDDRTASYKKVIRVLFSNATGVDMLNNIDALLASGDTNAALLVIDLVTGLLDAPASGAAENQTEAKKAKTAVRGKLIGALEKVSGNLQNYDQTSKTLGVLDSVTGVADEVTVDSKVGAAGALGNAGAAIKETTDDVPIDKVTDAAGGLINTAGNVMPFEEPASDDEGMTTAEPQIVITTTSSSFVAGQGHVTSTTTVVTTPTTRTVTTSSPMGVSVSTTPMTPTYTPSTTPETIGNISVLVDGVGEMTLSHEGWTTTAPLPTTTTTTTPSTTTTTTTTTTTPTTTTRRTTTTPSDEDVPGFMTTAFPGMEAEPTVEPEIPCCLRVPEGGLCDWVEPECEYLDEDDRKKSVWSDKVCDEIHPDDMVIFVKRYRLFKEMQKRILFLKRKSTTTNAMSAVSDVADVVTGKSASNSTTKIETPKMKVEMGKMDGSANGTSNGINFPGSALNGSTGSVGSLSMVSPNPFTYSDSAKDIKSDVKSLSFKDENGTEIVVQDSEPIDIWIEGQPHLVPPPKLSFVEHSKDTTTMNFHNILIPSNESSIHVMVRPDDPEDEFEVYIKYLDFPNETYFDYRAYIPNIAVDEWDASDEDKEDLRYTFFPDQSVTALNGSYKIGVKLIKSVVNYKAKAGDKRNSTYRFQVFTSGCRFWNKENDTWDTAGCWVGNLTTIRMTQCQCTHLTSFGGDFVVPPNTIDFSTVFSAEKFLEAVPVFVTVALVLLLYVGALIWARRADKKDVLKWGASPLEDNLPSDNYHYQITINTGVKKNASTTSRISFILSGDTGDTGVRRLSDGKRKEHPSGSIYNYVLSVEQTLGPLTYLRVWHDNTGSGKKRSWFLGQVQINDLQTGEKFFFLCDRWLAVEEDDGMVERILPVAGMNDLTAFKHLFNSSVRKKLTNDHLWVSIMSRPTRSNFTRVQRLSCCVSLLFLTMITNCMFFKADDKVENVSVLRVGPLTFTLHQLFISIVTTLIVFPPSMVIVIIFRKARAKKNAIQHMNQQMSKKTKRYKWRTFNPGSTLWNVERTRAQKFKDSVRNILSSSNHSKYEENQDERPLNKRKKKRFSLPHWTVYFAWLLVTVSILGSGFFTVLYSMEWGREKSLEWLSTFLLSFFQSVAVVQPIKVLLLAAFISCVLRKPDIDDEEGDFDENNAPPTEQTVLNRSQKDLQALMMQRKMANESLQPPDTEALEASRKVRLQELQMEAVLKECIIYVFFLLVLFFLSYQARDNDSFMYANNIKNTFVHNSPSFNSINSAPYWWAYFHKTLIPNLYSGEWYNGKDLDWRERLQMDDRNTMRVGVARIRQQRIKDDTCVVRKEFTNIVHHCRDHYSWTDDDTKDYLVGWEVPSSNSILRQGMEACYLDQIKGNSTNETSLHDEESPWVYRSSIELKNAPYAGTLALYKGGGYTFTFKRTKEHTMRLLHELELHEWVDVNTRALFIEFTLYNANVNLFGSVIMLVEFMATGSAITKSEVKVFRLSSYIGGFGILVVIFEVTFLFFVLYFMYNTCKLLKQQRLGFFKEFWSMLEFAMLILALISIVMYAMKKVFGTVAINALHESQSGDYVNFVTISIWDELFGFILAMVVFCATIKFIKMLKFNKRMSMLGDTICLATKDLKNFSIVFFGFFFAFCMMAYVLFGKMSPNYGSFVGSIEALFAFALGDFDFDEMTSIQPLAGPIFFFLYVAVIYIGMMGMFLTIIYDSFAEVKANAEHQSNDYEIVDFILKRFKGVFGWS